MEQAVKISAEEMQLKGDLHLPLASLGLVLFAHGSGSSRLSSRNRYVARALNKASIGTLLFDLLTEKEDENYQTRFNIPLLTERLILATQWVEKQDWAKEMPLAYFGASTGAAAALMAAAELRLKIRCVVSRGGRPDLAEERLTAVQCPTLLIMGGNDEPVIGLNRSAYAKLHCPKELVIIPGATHLFEEPGTLEEVARLATDWFVKHLK